MVNMTPEEWRTVGEAIVIWTGKGRMSSSSRDEEALVSRFGKDVTAKLLPILRELDDDYYSTDADRTAADLDEMGITASEHFRARYPDAPEDAVRALEWSYTFDHR